MSDLEHDIQGGSTPIEPETVKSYSDEELRNFVRDLCDNKIFTDRQVGTAEELPMVFLAMWLWLNGSNPPSAKYLESVGAVWEYLDKAGPRSVNGYPSFLSFHLMNKSDWEKAVPLVKEELERRKKWAEGLKV